MNAKDRVNKVLEDVYDGQIDPVADHYFLGLRAVKELTSGIHFKDGYALDSANPMTWTVKCKTCGRFEKGGKTCVHCDQRHLGIFSLVRGTETLGGPSGAGWSAEQKSSCRKTIESLIADLHKRGPYGRGKAWRNREEPINELNEKEVADIREANGNVSLSVGDLQTVETRQLDHALKSHGADAKTRKSNEVPITEDDLLLIPDILSDYDIVRSGMGRDEGKDCEAVEFWKKVDEHVFICVEVERFFEDGKTPRLKFQTMMKFEK